MISPLKTSLAFFLPALVAFAAAVLATIWVRHDLTHTEAGLVWAAVDVAAGKPLYPDWHLWPHRFYPYGPLFATLPGWVLRAVDQTGFGFVAYLLGRVQSVVSLYGIAALCGAGLYLLGYPLIWALALGLSFPILCADMLIPMICFRPDLPALFFCLGAALIAFNRPGAARHQWIAVLLYIISLAYKPTLLAFPPAFALLLVQFYSVKAALKWCAGLTVAVAVYVTAMNLATDGRFLLNILKGSAMGFTMDSFKLIWNLMSTSQPFLITIWTVHIRFVLAVGAAAYLIIKRCSALETGLAWYYLCSLVLGYILMLKVGAALHYLIEPYFLSLLVLASAARRWWLAPNRPPVRSYAIAVPFALLLFGLPLIYNSVKSAQLAYSTTKSLRNSDAYDRLMTMPPDVWLGDLAFVHPAIDAHGVCDPLWYSSMVKAGMLDPLPFRSRIEGGHFSHMVFSPQSQFLFMGSGMAGWVGKALEENYHLVEKRPEYQIWARGAEGGNQI